MVARKSSLLNSTSITSQAALSSGDLMKADSDASISISSTSVAGSGSTKEPLDLPSQLASILDEAWRAFEAKIYYPALSVALTMPDICVSLGISEKKTIVQRDDYVAWVDRYTTVLGLGCSGDACYKLRCGVLHRGDAAGHAYFGADSVVITVPGNSIRMHGTRLTVNDAVATSLDLEKFLVAIKSAVLQWYAEHGHNEIVRRNITRLVSWRPNGFLPFTNMPVIASGVEHPSTGAMAVKVDAHGQ